MNLGWISEKSASLMAFVVVLGLLAAAFLFSEYKYFFFCVALVVFAYGFKQLKKQDTPFEKRERELRRRTM